MRKIVMRGPLFLITLALSSAACSSSDEMEAATGVAGDTALQEIAAKPPTASRFEDNDERDGGVREFSYGWPAAVTAQPELARQLTAERDRLLAGEKVEWIDALADSPQDCTPCRNRSFAKEWKVVADLPGYLSLSADFSTYTGGAHGMYGLQSLVWDKTRRVSMNGVELFRSEAALDGALGPKLCRALNAEREKRRGEPVPPSSQDSFDRCVETGEATVLVGSSSGTAFDRIGVWFGPYVAGPYAEGAYELDFPVDAAVLRAAKPEYATAFTATR